jgi:hypothetical protein
MSLTGFKSFRVVRSSKLDYPQLFTLMGVDDNQHRYIPGWDCHGLPIENKALKELKVYKIGQHRKTSY